MHPDRTRACGAALEGPEAERGPSAAFGNVGQSAATTGGRWGGARRQRGGADRHLQTTGRPSPASRLTHRPDPESYRCWGEAFEIARSASVSVQRLPADRTHRPHVRHLIIIHLRRCPQPLWRRSSPTGIAHSQPVSPLGALAEVNEGRAKVDDASRCGRTCDATLRCPSVSPTPSRGNSRGCPGTPVRSRAPSDRHRAEGLGSPRWRSACHCTIPRGGG